MTPWISVSPSAAMVTKGSAGGSACGATCAASPLASAVSHTRSTSPLSAERTISCGGWLSEDAVSTR